jgi:hypothetical protein
MKLENNGKASSGKRTRHIAIRYFFITDRIASKEVTVQYCPTKQMVADYFTKPLQGALFYKFRDQIMGVAHMETIHGGHRSVLAEDKKVSGVSEKLKRQRANVNKIKPSRKINGQGTWAEVVKRGIAEVARKRMKRSVATAPRQ